MRLVIDLQACQSDSRGRGIGRYSLALTQAMVRRAGSHDCLVALNGAIADTVEPLRAAFTKLLPADRVRSWASTSQIAEALHGGERSAVAGEIYRQAMREFRPDFLHIGSLFEGWTSDVANVVGNLKEGLPTAVTFYDLTPFAQSQIYLDPHPLVRDWYMGKLEQLKQAELLFAISEVTKNDGVNRLGFDPDRIVNIRGACDEIFQPVILSEDRHATLRRRYGIDRPYVMYVGGFDHHKNIPSLIRAYAGLPTDVLQTHQLLIVGSPSADGREQIARLRLELGLRDDQCVLLGYVPDDDLVALYSYCRLYAFPSLQEGFGLPALEAMACGAVVVGSNVSSLPEVIGFEDALFNPHDLRDITAALLRGLCDEGFRRAFLDHARGQVKQFSWEESARRAWEGLEAAHERHRSDHKMSVSIQYLSTSSASRRVAAKWPGFADRSGMKAEQLVPDDRPSYFVISDGASALIAWQVMRQRTVGVVLTDSRSLTQVLRELHDQPEGKAMLEYVLADQGAYEVALQEGDLYYAALERTVRAWMERVAGQVIETSAAEVATPDEWGLHRCMRERRANEAIGRMLALPKIPAEDDFYWKDVAVAVNFNRKLDSIHAGRLLVDVSSLAVHDARTGIQRVVRNLLRQLLHVMPGSMQALPIYFDGKDNWRYARRFCWKFLGIPVTDITEDEIIDWLPGDRFIGLDLSAHVIPFRQSELIRLRDLGVSMNFVLYDMLPDTRPDCFESRLVDVLRLWYRSLGELSDGVICISRDAADDFVNWLDQAKIERARPIKVGHFHLGADPEVGQADELNDVEKAAIGTLEGKPTVLMVSTIEPRKAYQQALEAFELLWLDGVQVNLAIVGKAGWHTEELVERLRSHPEAGHRLHWFEGASDQVLHALYKNCDLLLSASEGEGFGLPLIEAAQYGIPLLLRDLRVFREVAGEHARYFEGYEPLDLANALEGWYSGLQNKQSWPDSSAIPWLTWQQSHEQFREVLEGKRWDYQIGSTPRYWFPVADPRMQTQGGIYRRGKLYAGDAPGFVIYGPYAGVVRGTYRIRAYGALDRDDPETWLDMVTDQGSNVIFKASLMPNEASGVLVESMVTLQQEVKAMEIRVWSSGQSQLRLDGFELIRQVVN